MSWISKQQKFSVASIIQVTIPVNNNLFLPHTQIPAEPPWAFHQITLKLKWTVSVKLSFSNFYLFILKTKRLKGPTALTSRSYPSHLSSLSAIFTIETQPPLQIKKFLHHYLFHITENCSYNWFYWFFCSSCPTWSFITITPLGEGQ